MACQADGAHAPIEVDDVLDKAAPSDETALRRACPTGEDPAKSDVGDGGDDLEIGSIERQ